MLICPGFVLGIKMGCSKYPVLSHRFAYHLPDIKDLNTSALPNDSSGGDIMAESRADCFHLGLKHGVAKTN